MGTEKSAALGADSLKIVLQDLRDDVHVIGGWYRRYVRQRSFHYRMVLFLVVADIGQRQLYSEIAGGEIKD